MSAQAKNILTRLETFLNCCLSVDDLSTISYFDQDICCSNCGLVFQTGTCPDKATPPAKRRAMFQTFGRLGRTMPTLDYPNPTALLCNGCARAFFHCKKRKDIVGYVDSIRSAYAPGFSSTSKFTKMSDRVVQCLNCNACCNEQHYEGFLTDHWELALCDSPFNQRMYTFRQTHMPFDICYACCRAFYIGQAFIFKNPRDGIELSSHGISPNKCQGRGDFDRALAEVLWSFQQVSLALGGEMLLPSTRNNNDDDDVIDPKKAAAIEKNRKNEQKRVQSLSTQSY